MKDYRIWTLQPGDPHLFVIPPEEAIDINTEFEFELAESLYRARRDRKAGVATGR